MPAMNQQCKVCNEPAAGFHFGAFTCEGCKSFFGRTYNNMATIGECKNNNKCVINKKNRTSCKACRLRKCLIVGMSKSGSRYGRRSNWFKIHCLLTEHNTANQNIPTIPAMPAMPAMPANVTTFAPSAYRPLQGLIPHVQVQHINNLYADNQDLYQSLTNFPGAKKVGTSSESGNSSVDCVETESCNSPSSYSQGNAASPSLPERECVPARRVSATVTLTSAYPHQNLGFMYPPPGLVTPATAQASPRGGDLYQVSPSPGGLAVEQDEPIDLSVKSGRTPSKRSASEEQNDRSESSKTGTTTNKSGTPLDLTLGVKKPKKNKESP